jgi:zinc protease
VDADYPALFMANYILGGNPSSRFMTRIRQKDGLSYSCGTMLQASPFEQVGSFVGFGMCAPENAAKALNAAKEEITLMREKGVGSDELADAKKGYRQQLEVRLSNDAQVASLLLTSLQADRTLSVEASQVLTIGALKPEEVVDALRRYINPSELVLVRAGDFDEESGPDSR